MKYRLVTLSGLWQASEFHKLWLGATPLQVAALTAVGFIAPAVMGLLAGVWVDRLPRRPLLIASDVGRALILGSVPLAAAFGVLHIAQLYAVQIMAGGCTALADTAAQAYLPTLIGRDSVVEGNSKLQAARSATRIVGPSLGGVLLQILAAPAAILLDAASFVASAVCLLLIRQPEPAPQPKKQPDLWGEMREGLYLVIRNRFLLPLARASAAYNLFAGMFVAVYALFMVRDLHLEAAMIGVIWAVGGVGGVVGGILAGAAARRVGLGPAIMVGGVLLAAGHVAAPVAFGPPLVVVPLLATAGAVGNFGLVLWLVNSTSLTQQIVSPHTLGRVSATQQTLVLATVPLGALVGGLIAEAAGPRLVVGLAAVGTIGSMLSLVMSPIPALRDVSQSADWADVALSERTDARTEDGRRPPRSPLGATLHQATIP